MNNNNHTYRRVSELRKGVREKVRAEVFKEHEEAGTSGKYPWEGMWLSPEVIAAAQKRLKKRDKTVFVEMLVLLAVVTALLLVFNQLVFYIIPGQKYDRQGGATLFSEEQSPDAPAIRDSDKAVAADETMQAGREEGAPDVPIASLPNAESTHLEYRDVAVAAPPSEKHGTPFETKREIHSQEELPKEKTAQSKKYYVQVGAWQNLKYALKAVQQINVQHPDALIEYGNHLYRVKIPDILSEKDGDLILKALRENFNLNALLVIAEQ